ncbi:MAG TPA: hypothetical protein VGA56_02400 [Opitutaceae bacterium]
MKLAALFLIACASVPVPARSNGDVQPQEVLVVVDATREPEFQERFSSAASKIEAACARYGVTCAVIGPGPESDDRRTDRDLVVDWLKRVGRPSTVPAWVIYVGHGTWDGAQARLNLRGPDLAAQEILSSLAGQRRPFVMVHGGSASGPFISVLSGANRVLVAATENGDEVNYARFGERFADAVTSSEADIDRDGSTSLLEAALYAGQQVRTFYDEARRMATEHALIDDNGDSRGTPLEWFRGTRVVRKDEGGASPDGTLARRFALIESSFERGLTQQQRERRAVLENQLETLRERKSSIDETDYLRELEQVLRELAPIYVDPSAADQDT